MSSNAHCRILTTDKQNGAQKQISIVHKQLLWQNVLPTKSSLMSKYVRGSDKDAEAILRKLGQPSRQQTNIENQRRKERSNNMR